MIINLVGNQLVIDLTDEELEIYQYDNPLIFETYLNNFLNSRKSQRLHELQQQLVADMTMDDLRTAIQSRTAMRNG